MFIININLNRTKVNPNIQCVALSMRLTGPLISKGNTMTTSAQTAPSSVPERTSSRALATLLLASGVSAIVVLADQWMAAWADRHEVAAWVVLWAVAVGTIMVLRGITRMMAGRAMWLLDSWSARVAQRRADERLWAMAQNDARMMAELQSALDHADAAETDPMQALSHSRIGRVVRNRLHYI